LSERYVSVDYHLVQYTEVFEHVTLCAAARNHDELDDLYRQQLRLDEMKAKSVVCDIPVTPVSSTRSASCCETAGISGTCTTKGVE
jgi:hypothetical protein